MWLLVLAMLLAAAMEGIGISLLLPLLQGLDDDNGFNLALRAGFAFFGVRYVLHNILLLLICIAVLRSVAMIAQVAYTTRLTVRLEVEFRKELIDKIFGLDYQAYIGYASGCLNNILTRELGGVVSTFVKLVGLMVQALFVAVYVAIPLIIKPELVLVLGIIAIPFAMLARRLIQVTKRYSLAQSTGHSELQKLIIQALNSFKYLRATASSPKIIQHIHSKSEQLGALQFRQALLGVLSKNGFEPVIVAVICGIIAYFVEYRGQRLTDQLFVLFMLMRAMTNVLGLQVNARKALGTWGSIVTFGALKKQLEEGQETVDHSINTVEPDLDATIIFKSVSFSYDCLDKPILTDINLRIEPNTTVAFVGESGAGKSTLINLVIGLLRPTQGQILLGGVPYRQLDKQKLRSQIGYITQESVIFHDTLKNNITMWEHADQVDMSEVCSASEGADLGGFISGLDQGYDSLLGEGGINISGGQRQRVCIARELYRRTKLLILDEATSSLDTMSEQKIQANIDRFRGEKTIILIAHRLSTVRSADTIFVLKDGKICERGSYGELCELGGEFKNMVDLQNAQEVRS